jgi:murein DD-endopeptidase MepM/ murein hydrolase activator NlpD
MKLKLKRFGRKSMKLFRHFVKKVYRKAVLQNAFSRTVRKFAKMEAGLATNRILRAWGKELMRRPRVKLAAASILTLILLMVFSAQGASALKDKEADIKINGKAVLVAEKNVDKNVDQAEIVASISPKISPFDYKYPVSDGSITQGFGAYHRAVDIATSFGSSIRPIGSGIVVFAGRVTDGKGNIVIIDHGDGLETIYAHMDKIGVGAGNMVNGNSILGTVGMTGHTTGPHVHLEVYDHGVAINPSSVLPD